MKMWTRVLASASLIALGAPAAADTYPFEASVIQTSDLADDVYQRYYTTTRPSISPGCSTNCGLSGIGCDMGEPSMPYCRLTYGAKGQGGYRGYTEDLFGWGNAPYGTVFTAIFDFGIDHSGAGHTGYYAWVTGPVLAETSRWNELGCVGTSSVACLGNPGSADAHDVRGPMGYIDNIGGLSPIPVPLAYDLDGDGNAGTKGGEPGWYQLSWAAVTSVGKAPGATPAGYELYFYKDAGGCGVRPSPADFTYLRTVTTSTAEVRAEELGIAPGDPAAVTFALRIRFPPTSDGRVIATRFLSANGQCFASGLPVSVYDLRARSIGRGTIEVAWRTSLEDEVSRYDVQRGFTANGPFHRVGSVDANGEPASYRYLDRPRTVAPDAEGLFYRLIAIEWSNRTTTFGPVAADVPTPGSRRP